MLAHSDTTRVPEAIGRAFKSLASTVSQSSEPTYEETIEFSIPCKPATVRLSDNIGAHSTVRRRRREKEVHTGLCHSSSKRSGNRSTVVNDKQAMHDRIASTSNGQISRLARLIWSKSSYSNRSARASASG